MAYERSPRHARSEGRQRRGMDGMDQGGGGGGGGKMVKKEGEGGGKKVERN